MKPGKTVRPSRSITRAPAPTDRITESSEPTARMRLPRIASAACSENEASTGSTVPPRKTISAPVVWAQLGSDTHARAPALLWMNLRLLDLTVRCSTGNSILRERDS